MQQRVPLLGVQLHQGYVQVQGGLNGSISPTYTKGVPTNCLSCKVGYDFSSKGHNTDLNYFFKKCFILLLSYLEIVYENVKEILKKNHQMVADN